MKLMIFALYDTVANCQAGPLITERAAAPAIRAFHDALAQGDKTMPGRYPDNYELKCVGSIDDETMQLEAQTPPLTIATGKQWLEVSTPAAASAFPGLRSEPETSN